MSILVIFFMTQHNPMLRDIRSQLCGARFEAEVDQSIELMLDWIRFVAPAPFAGCNCRISWDKLTK